MLLFQIIPEDKTLMKRNFSGHEPFISNGAYVDETAVLIGKVNVSEGASVWPGAVLRGDVERIELGRNSNIQDCTVLHTNWDMPVVIGESVTVGHAAVLHGAIVSDYCLISMGAVLLDGVRVPSFTIVAAGAVVPEGKILEGESVYMGTPARKVRDIRPAEKELIIRRSSEYKELAKKYLENGI
jgi:carbonic anhydrase/acetyltransferase-like protein (isoleucine patch superfamily)